MIYPAHVSFNLPKLHVQLYVSRNEHVWYNNRVCDGRLFRTRCAGGMEIDIKNFNNVMLMAVVMGLIGVSLSLNGVEEAVGRTGVKSKSSKNGAATTPKKKTK